MASIIKKKKGNTVYYYVVESARVDGKPCIVHQTYLGTAEGVCPPGAGQWCPGAACGHHGGVRFACCSVVSGREDGGLRAARGALAQAALRPFDGALSADGAIHRICAPGPKTEVADWYRDSILSTIFGFAPERFTSQAFWDCFDTIHTGESLPRGQRDDLEEAQSRLLGLWNEKQLVNHRLLAYDTTNFYTYIASNNERNPLAQRGHNKQGRNNLR